MESAKTSFSFNNCLDKIAAFGKIAVKNKENSRFHLNMIGRFLK